MTLEELEKELLSDEERLTSSLEKYKSAKAELRKARITSISNKLLAPYRRFRIKVNIVKSDLMAEAIRKKKKLDKKKDELFQVLEEKIDASIKFGEEIGSEVIDTFDYIKEIGSGKVSKASSFVVSVKKVAIKKVKENSTIDLTIKKAIEDVKLKYITNKYNRAVKQKKKEDEKAREQELNRAINFDEGVKIELKSRDVPFSNINEKIQKARKQSSYMGKATNRVVRYFKKNKDYLMSTINEKRLDNGMNRIVSTYEVLGKVIETKSKVITVFNNKIDDFKGKADDMIDDVMSGAESVIGNISSSLNNVKDSIHQTLEDRRIEREGEIGKKRKQSEKDVALKRAQLDSMREALEAINSTSDLFNNAPSLEGRKTM